MRASVENLEKAAVEQQFRALRLPAVAEQCAPLAEVAVKQRQTYLRYLEALLAAELEERERNTIARSQHAAKDDETRLSLVATRHSFKHRFVGNSAASILAFSKAIGQLTASVNATFKAYCVGQMVIVHPLLIVCLGHCCSPETGNGTSASVA